MGMTQRLEVPHLPDGALRVCAFLGGQFFALAAIALAAFLLFTDPTRGRSFPLSWLGDAQDLLNILGAVFLAASVTLVAFVIRSTAIVVLSVFTAGALLASVTACILRLAGVLVLTYPFAAWVPGFLFLYIWCWGTARRCVEGGRLPRESRRIAAVMLASVLLAFAVAAVSAATSLGGVQTALYIAAERAGRGVRSRSVH